MLGLVWVFIKAVFLLYVWVLYLMVCDLSSLLFTVISLTYASYLIPQQYGTRVPFSVLPAYFCCLSLKDPLFKAHIWAPTALQVK